MKKKIHRIWATFDIWHLRKTEQQTKVGFRLQIPSYLVELYIQANFTQIVLDSFNSFFRKKKQQLLWELEIAKETYYVKSWASAEFFLGGANSVRVKLIKVVFPEKKFFRRGSLRTSKARDAKHRRRELNLGGYGGMPPPGKCLNSSCKSV